MDVLKPIVKRFTYDFYMRRDGLNVEPHRGPLYKSQYLSADELAALQLRKLKDLLTHCWQNNPFYRRRFETCGFQPGDLNDFSVLCRLPILTKDDIRENFQQMFSEGFTAENTMAKRTGGSTGIPVRNYWDWPAAGFKRAGAERHNAWAHLVPGARQACVWGDTDKSQPLKARLRNSLMERAFYLDTLKFDEEHLKAFVGQLRKFRPEVLMGHAHSVYRLAEYVRDQGIDWIRFKGVITTAMVLSPLERMAIESVFQSPVFDRYGCEELSLIASECEAHEGKHIFAEGLYVEIANDVRLVPGELIITDLVNYGMPLIRYQIGDCGELADGQCPCGRGLPRLAEVRGRTADFLYTPNRKPVFGISILDTFVIHIPGFKQVQIVQDAYDHLDFHIVKDPGFSEESLQLLKKNVVEIFGPDMRYDLHFVERIAQTQAGKYRFSICNIDRSNKNRD